MATEKGPSTIVMKEMGITHNDFYAELPALLDDIPYQRSEDTIRFRFNDKRIEIVLGPEGVRQVGRSVRLPVTHVTIRFFACSAQEISDFIRLFNLRFMKGGG